VDELSSEVTEDVQVPVTEEAPPAGDAATETDPFESGADSFDRAYVERLRKESAQYRTKAKEFEPLAQAFEPYNDEDRAVWNEAMRLFAEDPKAGAEYMDKIVKAVQAGFEKERAEAEAPITDDNDKPLTRAEYAALREAEKAQAAQDAEVARIESEAKELGYDPASDEYTYLLTVASRLQSGDIKEAHAKIEAAYQARIDKYLAAKAADAEGAGAPPADAGDAPSGERLIRSFKDAREAALARVEASKIHG
jgi:hypothetical protein